jgi:hypothetical protein
MPGFVLGHHHADPKINAKQSEGTLSFADGAAKTFVGMM